MPEESPANRSKVDIISVIISVKTHSRVSKQQLEGIEANFGTYMGLSVEAESH